MIKIIESPREGMQGFSRIIPTREKVDYINQLLKVGFDTVETGSMVSPRHIPQMADSEDVFNKLNLSATISNRMFLAVNLSGAEKVMMIPAVSHVSFPFSFSSTFLKLNVNSTVEQSFETVVQIINRCAEHGKTPVFYISMAFGNPYGDPWNIGLLAEWTNKLYMAGAGIIALSNVSIEIDSDVISEVYSTLIPMFPDVEFGLHLHTSNNGWYEKVDAAFTAGCRRFDSVINGRGGCPMAGKELLGNLKTENMVKFAMGKGMLGKISLEEFEKGCEMASVIG